ncbi:MULTISPECIES: aldose epimerase family protein [unclassified Bosea (in: a-proteobacteria)]|uniref:aldose epimerase family protein n=1 Tax=unclassified Bosea (in: a-proteobacteria) TaxID=2653178 RepID=UPI000956FCA2|nr:MULTISPECIES: aldose epimerase family protein [unclassified Bosea (in: a-proteobacteria)]TAJ28920.1 MAG: galactose mutarotase [Bosea sp. (in: a-proteobacteria)]SIR12978.1 aldose 1-epimerase [Bosea sp. TND4EK4]
MDARVRLCRDIFGRMPDDRPVERITLRGTAGFEVAVITWGASVQALHVPDRHGEPADIVLGFDTLAPYLASRSFFGATVGRYANRIADAAFMLDGTRCRLPPNDGANCLHGGAAGFDHALWTVEDAGDGPEPFVTLGHVSPDDDQGFPGRLTTRLTYRVVNGHSLAVTFEAVTDRPTVVNLTHHGFFNLAGAAAGESILDHELTILADSFLPVDAGLIPNGAPAPVAGTPFDFRDGARIGARIREADAQLRFGLGYDHCYCLHNAREGDVRLVARVLHRESGRGLELMTDQPGLQLYTGNRLDGTVAGKHGRLHRQSDAFCLEPQGFPDAPNRPDFPPSRLDPGGTYRHRSVFRFFTAREGAR